MFDNYSSSLFDKLSIFNIDSTDIKRSLSKAYMYSIQNKLIPSQEVYQTVDLSILSEEDLEIQEELDYIQKHSSLELLYSELRKIGDFLESKAVFERVPNQEIVKASAFISGEALSLLSTLLIEKYSEDDFSEELFSNEIVFTKIESSILFFISGYYANAMTEVRSIKGSTLTSDINDQENDLLKIELWCFNNLVCLLTNELWNVTYEKPLVKFSNRRKTLKNIIYENKLNMYSLIGDAILNYITWLIGNDESGKENSIVLLRNVNDNTKLDIQALYPELHHLSKMLISMVENTYQNSLFFSVPLPQDDTMFIQYLKLRAKGNSRISSRPLIWESAKEFISKSLPGPKAHTIVNLPTGSGKSFIAELAIAQAISNGWILYLAPTNALVHQIKKDLKELSSFLNGFDIKSFISNREYTTLDDEYLTEDNISDDFFVAVMTPEKCSMSLRMNPNIFMSCSLVIFDECHVLNDGERGVISDLVLGQILAVNPDTKFLLMSAMLGNPASLAQWLNTATETNSEICSVSWKPTRSLRGAVGIEMNSFKKSYFEAKEQLMSLRNGRVNFPFETDLTLVFSLSGIWKKDFEDYALAKINVTTNFKVNRRRDRIGNWRYENVPISWVNNTSRDIGQQLAVNNISTIVFISTNRHYPFLLAEKVNVSSTEFSQKQELQLLLAEKELGVNSEVKSNLIRGVGIHTSYLLEFEKEVVEEAFKEQKIKLIFATGTLAQGLNLPSVAVVIAGNRVGNPQDAHTNEAQSRSKALMLNAIGRAGRAGYSNQSFSILVPDEPFLIENNENKAVKFESQHLSILEENDASLIVASPIEEFLNRIINQSVQLNEIPLNDLRIVSMLTFTEDENLFSFEKTKQAIKNTFGVSSLEKPLSEEELDNITIKIGNIGEEFLQLTAAPRWVLNVSKISGFDYYTTNIFRDIISRNISLYEGIREWSTENWLQFLFLCLKDLPPYYLKELVPSNPSKSSTFLNQMARDVNGSVERNINWNKTENWDEHWENFFDLTLHFMKGSSYAKLARLYLNIPSNEKVDSSRKSGKPIPQIFSLITKQIYWVAGFSGLLVAILEEIEFSDEDMAFNLSSLPLLLKNGLKDYSALYWYKYFFKNRLIANSLGDIFPLKSFVNEETSRKEVRLLSQKILHDPEIHLSVPEESTEIITIIKSLID